MSKKHPPTGVVQSAAGAHKSRVSPFATHEASPPLPEDVRNISGSIWVGTRRRRFSEEALQKEIDEMFEIYETLGPGWDGDDAKSVNRSSLSDAREFLGMRPKEIRLPHPQIDPDGFVGLWWKTPQMFAGVDFLGNGLISYYARQATDDGPPRMLLRDDCLFASGWPRELCAMLPRNSRDRQDNPGEKRDSQTVCGSDAAHLLPDSNPSNENPPNPDTATSSPGQSKAGGWSASMQHADNPPGHDDFPEAELQKELDEKFAIYETLKPGWDTYSADPLNPKSLSDARRFLEARPRNIRLPHPQLGSDGIVDLYWETKHGFACVGFEGNGLLSYYAKLPAGGKSFQKFHGDDILYSDGWPKEFVNILEKMRVVGRPEDDCGK